MNKMIIKIATCGVLALGIQAASAQQMQLAKDAAAKVATSETAKAFAKNRLGLVVTKTTTNAELTAAINSLSAADQLAAIKLINKFANVASVNQNAAAINEGYAASILKDKSGQLVQLASAQGSEATRGASEDGAKCERLTAAGMAAGSKYSEAEVKHFMDSKILVQPTCVENLAAWKGNAKNNILGTVECADRAGVGALKGDARSDVFASCLKQTIKTNDGVEISDLAAKQKIQGLNKCGPLGQNYVNAVLN